MERLSVSQFKLLLLGTAMLLSPEVLACTPRNQIRTAHVSAESERVQQIDREIGRMNSALVLAASRRPDCLIHDIETELELISMGFESGSQLPIDGISSDSAAAIMNIRAARKNILRREAPIIQSMTPGSERTLKLADLYGAMSSVELSQAQRLPNQDPVRDELAGISECHATKALSLTVPIARDRLLQERNNATP